MNITRLNLRESLPLVQSAISRAHFLSLDLEMSGITTEELTSPSILDSVRLPLADAKALREAAAVG
jgi:hypothetical protein